MIRVGFASGLGLELGTDLRPEVCKMFMHDFEIIILQLVLEIAQIYKWCAPVLHYISVKQFDRIFHIVEALFADCIIYSLDMNWIEI